MSQKFYSLKRSLDDGGNVKGNVYYDNDAIYPLADELVNCFSKFLETKGIWFFNDDSDEYQMKNRHAIYGEDFRNLQEMVQKVLNKRL